jgi:hypothetical protein
MKSLTSFVLAVSLAAVSTVSASVTFTGVSVRNGVGIAAGDRAIFIVDQANIGFNAVSMLAGNSITASASFGSGFTVVGDVTASTVFGSTNVGSPAPFNLGGGVDTGDRFAVVVFSQSTTSAIAGDSYTIWTDPTWVIPADSATVGFANPANGGFLQLSGTTANFSKIVQGSVIPEPSSFAALAGLVAVGFAASRRRRA